MVITYALIRKGEILKLRNVPDDDTLAITKMVAHGYLPVIEGAVPTFDYITQSVSDAYEINIDNVTRKWTLQEQQFGEAKRMKEEEIKSKALVHFRDAFDSHNESSMVSDTLKDKKKYMTALSVAKNNNDLRNIDVEYDKIEGV